MHSKLHYRNTIIVVLGETFVFNIKVPIFENVIYQTYLHKICVN